MQAILAGLRSLDSVSGTNRYAQLMEKLSAGGSNMLAGDSHILIDLSSWYKASLAPKIELLHQAIHSGREVTFTYFATKGESRRRVEPYDLVFQWASWYLWGWCESRRDFRLFKLMRMTDLQAGGLFEKRAAPLPDLSAERVFPNVYQVKARIQPEFKWRLVEEYGPDCFTVEPDGTLLFPVVLRIRPILWAGLFLLEKARSFWNRRNSGRMWRLLRRDSKEISVTLIRQEKQKVLKNRKRKGNKAWET